MKANYTREKAFNLGKKSEPFTVRASLRLCAARYD